MRNDLQKQEVSKFLGVNLRSDRLDLADEECAKAINADFNTTVGTILVRRGSTKQFNTPLADLAIRFLAKVNSFRYQVAGRSVYRDQAKIINALLSATLKSSVIPYRPFNDPETWAFIADGSIMKKDNGTSTYKWGIDPPTATPGVTTTGTGLTGSYSVKFTYARVNAGALCHESNPSPASATQALVNQNLSVTGLTASTDAQVTHIRLYRNVSGGTVYLFDQQIANGTTTATSSQADSALGVAVDTDNDVPPNCSWATIFNETVFLLGETANPHHLNFSRRLRPESVFDYIEIGNADDPLVAAVQVAGVMGVWTRKTKYRVTGSSASSYTANEHLSRRGTPSPYACIPTEYGIVFPAKDGVFATNLMAADKQIADAIQPIFQGETVNGLSPINWDAASTFCGEAYKDRYYFSYASGSNTAPDKVAVYSHDTTKWYFFDRSYGAMLVEEDIDDLVAGGADGLVYIIEDADATGDAGTDISMDVETKSYTGPTPHGRKLFLFARVDAYIPSGTLTAALYVDGTLKYTHTLTGNRTKNLLRFPQESMGFDWKVTFAYTGTGRAAIYGVAAAWAPLAAA
jgi:hypothetical protein